MTIAEAFRVFGEALDVEFAGEQSVAEVLSTIAVKFGGTRQQSIADAANEIAKVADHITAIGDATLVTKSITDNGTYNATSDEADGYSTVTVEVQPNLTTKSITNNGTYNATSDEADGYSTVTVEVPAPTLTGFEDVRVTEMKMFAVVGYYNNAPTQIVAAQQETKSDNPFPDFTVLGWVTGGF